MSDRNGCTKASSTDMRSCGQNRSSLPNMSIASGGAPRYVCCRLHGALNGNSDRYCSAFPSPRMSSIVGVPITSKMTFNWSSRSVYVEGLSALSGKQDVPGNSGVRSR